MQALLFRSSDHVERRTTDSLVMRCEQGWKHGFEGQEKTLKDVEGDDKERRGVLRA